MKWGVVVAGLRGLTLYIVRDILYNTDVITAIVKLIVCSPVGKVVSLTNMFCFCLISSCCEWA